jgi:hypothetical protein
MTSAQRARLYAARELIIVAVADRALDALIVALDIEHPTLAAHDQPARPPTLRRARSIARLATRLRVELRRYSSAVDDALRAPDTAPDDLPF